MHVSFLVGLAKALIGAFGDTKEKADLEVYNAGRAMLDTPEGGKFLIALSRASLINISHAVSNQPIEQKITEDTLSGSEVSGPNQANREPRNG